MKNYTLIALICFTDPIEGTLRRILGLGPAPPRTFPALEHVKVEPRLVKGGCDSSQASFGHEKLDISSFKRFLFDENTLRNNEKVKCGLNRNVLTENQIRDAFAKWGEALFSKSTTITPLYMREHQKEVAVSTDMNSVSGQTIHLGQFLAFALNSDVKLGIHFADRVLETLLDRQAPSDPRISLDESLRLGFLNAIHPDRVPNNLAEIRGLFE
jgi:hypothetical protein